MTAMDQEQLIQLEKASVDLMSPPHSVGADRRQEAEAIFMGLRKSKLPYSACKFILENSRSDYVLFQSASTIREAIIREWPILSMEEKTELRTYLMHYLTSHLSLTGYVRNQLLQIVALLVKRATLEVDCKQLFGSVLDSVAQMLATGDVRMRQLGCSLLSALMTEYSSSSSIGLPLEFHAQCKQAIEKEQLLHVLHFAVQVLQQFLLLDFQVLSQEDHTLLSSFLSLASQVLNWDFQQKNMFRSTINTHSMNIILKPPKSYASTFLDPSFLQLFFQLLSKLKSNEDDFHHVVQCLTQLSSVTTPIFSSDEEQKQYLTNFVAGFLDYVHSSSELSQQEVYGLSCILCRLTTTFSLDQFAAVGVTHIKSLLQIITQLACLSAQKITREEDEEKALGYKESLEHFLEVCVTFITYWSSAPSFPPKSTLHQPMVDIFNAYIQSKLSAPNGWRVTLPKDEEIIDIEEDDREAYADELSSIGCIARTIASHSLPLLVSLLEECSKQYLQLFLLIQHDPSILVTNQNHLDILHEDLHWLVMIAGFTLCDIVRGEMVQIPTELMRFSITCYQDSEKRGETKKLDFDRNVAALVLDANVAGDDLRVELMKLDSVTSLVFSVCRLCVLEKQFISQGLLDLLSPQLCETTVWCLSRITEPYVMFREDIYQQVSLPLVAAFGKGSESGRWLTAFLVDKVAFNMSVWSSEENLSLVTIQLLQSIVKSQLRAEVCIQCDVLWTLMHSFSSGSGSFLSLPPRVQKGLMGSLVMCAVGEKKKIFLTELLQSFQTRFLSLVQSPEFRTHYSELDTKWALLTVLEPMCGLAGCIKMVYVKEFFDFLYPILRTCVSLLELYCGMADVVAVILELFSLVAENYIVFLDQTNCTKLYEVCLSLIQIYAKCNTGKYSKLGLAEEEQCEDLLLFMKLLSHLTTKDFLDFAPKETTRSDLPDVKPVDVVVTGISIVLPLMSEETLKFPKLCSQFFTLMHYMCLDFPEKVLTLPDKMTLAFMKLLEMGLTNFTQDICIDSLECIESLAAHTGSSSPHLQSLTFLTESFQHFLKVIFEMILSSSFDMDLIGPASSAVFILICIQQEYYSSLAEVLVSSQSSDPWNHTRLVQAFQQLTPPSLTLDLSKDSKQTFRKNLEQFLPFVKGFLFYR